MERSSMDRERRRGAAHVEVLRAAARCRIPYEPKLLSGSMLSVRSSAAGGFCWRIVDGGTAVPIIPLPRRGASGSARGHRTVCSTAPRPSRGRGGNRPGALRLSM